jgi:hypothetical protein
MTLKELVEVCGAFFNTGPVRGFQKALNDLGPAIDRKKIKVIFAGISSILKMRRNPAVSRICRSASLGPIFDIDLDIMRKYFVDQRSFLVFRQF